MAGNEIVPDSTIDAAGNRVSGQPMLGDGTGPLAAAKSGLDTGIATDPAKAQEGGEKQSTFAKAVAEADAETAAAKAAADKAAAEAAAKADTPEAKAAAEKAAAEKKAADDKAAAEKATKITAAEKALADAKSPEEKAAAQKALDELKGSDKPKGAPEKYEPFKLPEGVVIDEAGLKEFEPVARELNLTQDQAQKLINIEASRAVARTQDAVKNFNAFMDKELSVTMADPEIGGQNYDTTISNARVAIKAFGTPALKQYLGVNPAGNNVEVLRLLANIGKMVREDTFIPGNKPVEQEQKSLADRLFPATATK